MMEVTTDDNFFIDDPQKLRHNFFNKDKSIQMVELLAQKHPDSIVNKKRQLERIQTCRLTYNKKLLQIQHLQQHTTMPRSFITRLEILCQATYNTSDISVAKQAVDTLVNASNSGCCFLEKYIVMLLNFCTKNHSLAHDDETLKIKTQELLDRVLIVDFDRQQLTENLRRPENKFTSVEHIIYLLRRVQDMLDYREHKVIDWLGVFLDAYFVELATTDEAVGLIDQISAHISHRSALLRETESTKCLLNTVLEQLDNTTTTECATNNKEKNSQSSTMKTLISVHRSRHERPYYSVELMEI